MTLGEMLLDLTAKGFKISFESYPVGHCSGNEFIIKISKGRSFKNLILNEGEIEATKFYSADSVLMIYLQEAKRVLNRCNEVKE